MTNPFQPRHHVNGTVAHEFPHVGGEQARTVKIIIRTDAGWHTDPQTMPFSSEGYEGRRVRLVDGVWRLEARAA